MSLSPRFQMLWLSRLPKWPLSGSPRFLGFPSLCALRSRTPATVPTPLPFGVVTSVFHSNHSVDSRYVLHFEAQFRSSHTCYTQLHGSVTLSRVGSLLACQQALARRAFHPLGIFIEFHICMFPPIQSSPGAKSAVSSQQSAPGRREDFSSQPPQTRTSRIPASGSSKRSIAAG